MQVVAGRGVESGGGRAMTTTNTIDESADARVARGMSIENRPIVTGLPGGTYVEYFGMVKGGANFVIYRPRDGWDYGDFRCAMRAPGMPTFIPIPIIKPVLRYRDGGTTIVEIESGKFVFPTPFEPEKKPTFNDEPLLMYERYH